MELYLHANTDRDVTIKCVDYAHKPYDLSGLRSISVWTGSNFLPNAVQYRRYDQYFNGWDGETGGTTRTDLLTLTDAANGELTLHLTDTELRQFPADNDYSMIEFSFVFADVIHKDWVHAYVNPAF